MQKPNIWKRAICVHIYRFPNIRCLLAERFFAPYRRQSAGFCARVRIHDVYNIKDNPHARTALVLLLCRSGNNKNELNGFSFFFLRHSANAHVDVCLFPAFSLSWRAHLFILFFLFEFYSGHIREECLVYSASITRTIITL